VAIALRAVVVAQRGDVRAGEASATIRREARAAAGRC
jgi:hypothetical protein